MGRIADFDAQVRALRPTAPPKRCQCRKAEATPAQWAAQLNYNLVLKSSPEAKARDRERSRQYRLLHPDVIKAQSARVDHKARRGYYREYKRKRRLDPQFRLVDNLRSHLYHTLQRSRRGKTDQTLAYCGCSASFLLQHIESLFQPGMAWDNWGRGPGKWHLDHVIPLSAFDVDNPTHMRLAWHWKNLRPTWGAVNLHKQGGVFFSYIAQHYAALERSQEDGAS